MRIPFAATMAAAALFVVPTAAHAAEVAIQTGPAGGKTLSYRAGPGEVNRVSLNLQGANYTIQDLAGPPMTIEPPCSTWVLAGGLGTGATCPATGVGRIAIDLGDEADEVFLGGISNILVPATIRGGPGPDRLSGGDGADTIEAVDGSADTIDCRDGNDTVHADEADAVQASCETVDRGQAPAPEPPPPPAAAFDVSVAVAHRYRVIGAPRPLTVHVGCSAACTITARLVVGRGPDAEVGRAPTTSLPSAGRARLVMTLSRTAWRHVRRLHARRLTLETRVVGPSGGAVTVRTPVVLAR